MDDRLTIETPENVELTYDLAGLGSRAVAALVDHLLILAAVLAILLLALVILALLDAASLALDILTPGEFGQLELNTGSFAFAFLLLAWFAVIWGFFLYFETRSSGQSPGKKVTDLRVLRDDGGPVNFGDVLLRTFLRTIDFLPFGYFLGMVAILTNRRGKRLGDFAAGTVVVRLRPGEVSAPFLLPLREGREDLVSSLRRQGVHRLAAHEVEMALTFLRRRDSLDPERRSALAGDVADTLARRLGTVYEDPEAFLEGLVLAHHRTSGGERGAG